MKLFIFLAVSLFILFAISALVSPTVMLMILGAIIIVIPVLIWGIEITKGFKDLRSREKEIEIRRNKLNSVHPL